MDTTAPIVTPPAEAIFWALVRAWVIAAARASSIALAGSSTSNHRPPTSVAPLAVAVSITSPALSRSRTVICSCSPIL